MSALQLSDLRMDYPRGDGGTLHVLDGVNLSVRAGEVFGVVGPSGCGKTTLLDLVIGLAEPTGGTIGGTARGKAMVFQRPQLLPWRTVLENALYGIECRRDPTPEDRDAAEALLRRMRLQDHLHEHPHRLSEGMKQRVNLARALMVEPELLLMDEPFAALDPLTVRRLADDLLALWAEREMAIVIVSHSLPQLAYLADRIAVLSDKPTTVRAIDDVDLPRPRSADPEAQLRLLERADALTRRYFHDD